MKKLRFFSLMMLIPISQFFSCDRYEDIPAQTAREPKYSLVYGGDILLGNFLNETVYSNALLDRVFGDTAPIFRKADIAFVNAEGVIAKGGQPAYKGERNPVLFRIHPNILRSFSNAGIDVVSVGNNHIGDYGRPAFVEMLDRLSVAGIEYVGGGYNALDAERPVFFTVEDVVIAIVAANMSFTRMYSAKRRAPGTLHFKGFGDSIDERVVEKLTGILQKARRQAHLVFFSPHWGYGWTHKTRPEIREFAKKLIKAGYDGILGHSSHRFHGAEIIDGKPVLYDAGNFNVYWTDDEDESNQGLLYELFFTKAGVTGVRTYPLRLTKNATNLARGSIKTNILNHFIARSNALGTSVRREDISTFIPYDPGDIKFPSSSSPPPKRRKAKKIREAPLQYILDQLPADLQPLDMHYSNGIHLIGSKVEPSALPKKKNNVLISLYFTTYKKIDDSVRVCIEIRGDTRKGEPHIQEFNHFPGDWLFPTNEWNFGQLIRDTVFVRLETGYPGSIQIYAGLENLRPISSLEPLVDDELVLIGVLDYVEQGTGIVDILKAEAK